MNSPGLEQHEAYALAHPSEVLSYAFAGLLIEVLSMGIIISQVTYWYFTSRKADSWWLQALVCSLATICWAQFFLICVWMWKIFVAGPGVLEVFSTTYALCLTVITLVPIVLVECFYLERAYKLWGESKWIIALVSPFMQVVLPLASKELTRSVATVALSIWDYTHACWNIVGFTSGNIFRAYLVATIITDVSLTILIAIPLWRARTGFRSIDNLTMRLVIFTAQCQLFPTLSIIGLLIKSFILPWSFTNLLFISGANTWVITAMIVINARAGMRREMENEMLRQNLAVPTTPETPAHMYNMRNSGIFSSEDRDEKGDIYIRALRITPEMPQGLLIRNAVLEGKGNDIHYTSPA